MHLEELKQQLRGLMILIMAGSCSAATITLTLVALTLSSPNAVPNVLPIA